MTLKMLAALGVVIGLFLLLYALARKSRTWLPGAKAQNSIDVRAVRHLGPKRALYLIDVDGRRFFLCAGGEQIRLLSEWEAPQESHYTHLDAQGEMNSKDVSSFAALLQRQFRGGKSPVAEAKTGSPRGTENSGATSATQEDKSCPEE
jgi:flagellar biogenesis protein FliO